MAQGEVSAVTLASKGSSLSSSSVYAVATGRSQVRIDSSLLDRLSSTTSTKHTISIPDFLTLEQSRAFLLVLLNKLLLCSNSPGRVIPLRISESLNSNPHTFQFEDLDATEDDLHVLTTTTACSTLLAVSAIIDHQSAPLSTLADVAAAFSCEALKADVTAFNLMDSGDGHTSKDEVGVAGDVRVLLNGSKFVGKDKIPSIMSVPEVHGSVRVQAKLVHSQMRVKLNSGHKLGESELGSGEAVSTVLFGLVKALCDLGDCSFARAQSNLGCIGSDGLKSSLGEIFGNECPTDADLSSGFFNAALKFVSQKEYGKFACEVNKLLGIVWKIVAWETVTAFAVLEAAELSERIQGVQENGEPSKVEKKKKKVVLGKGTSSILTLIKERLLSEEQSAVQSSRSLKTWVADFISILDLSKPEFDDFLLKVKDIVESNESRRLPKIPKVQI